MLELAALLAVLGLADGKLSMLVLADGASWIRDWFTALGIKQKSMILCWWHLVKRCYQQLSLACKGRDHREEVQQQILCCLWEGRVDDALCALQQQREAVKNLKALEDLIRYLENRRPYIPNYKSRQKAGLRIASTAVEKLNDWAVSNRCKHRGMSWVYHGVDAVAAIKVAQRNQEWEHWQQTGQLPSWEELGAKASTAVE